MAACAQLTAKYEVFSSPEKGRGLKAYKKFFLGEAVLTEKPFVSVLSSKFRGRGCDFCFKATQDVMRCSRCKFMRYCGKECQKKSWKLHKEECGNLERVSPKVPTDTALLISRILLAKKLSEDLSWFDQLLSHKDDRTAEENEGFSSLFEVLKEFYGGENMENAGDVFELFGKVSANTFTICDEEMQAIGLGLYPTASLINHSCDPNCVAMFCGESVCITAVREIQPGDEILISYVELMIPGSERRKQLKEGYFFDCCCSLCSSPQGKEQDKLMFSVRCKNKSCKEPVMKNEGTDESYHCASCGEDFDQSFTAQVQSAEEIVHMSLLEIGQHHALGDYASVIELCKDLLQNDGQLFHDLNYKMVQVLDKAMDAAINSELWSLALEYGERSLPAYNTYCSQYHPAVGIQMFRIGKLKLLLNELVSGMQYLEKARSTLEVTHGVSHNLVLGLKEILFQTIQDIAQAPKQTAKAVES